MNLPADLICCQISTRKQSDKGWQISVVKIKILYTDQQQSSLYQLQIYIHLKHFQILL